MASIHFMKTPIDEIAVTDFEGFANTFDRSEFGLTHHDFYLKDFSHLSLVGPNKRLGHTAWS